MTELRFRMSLYSSSALDRALEAFASLIDYERESRDEMEVIRLTARAGEDESWIAGEFANFVLGATVDGVDATRVEEA
ncbi:MAG TPA: HxsD-like protein [Polyangiaceae bacterium]|jgi:hypothetical protein|nr:MAG: hypothetical protein BWY17_01156 [Deltaproteobacteria bacterium ADurb.Bin207]HNS95615.1 HxsD-like protein [Polyangiaceae bacterium]HNZ21231.1 HxsD-like protein [Polyangiaceae bacterium]HOD21083.1 HxsD-like protein [Polyangiaceae bacterium]HOE48023.1 HxsD-like protein [Polyangiaceae bacterium]